MRMLGVLGVIHPLAAPLGAGIALEGRDQAPAARMDREVDGSIGRFEQGLDELEPIGFLSRRPRFEAVPALTPARSYSPRTVGPTAVRALPAGSIETRSRPMPIPQSSRVFSRISWALVSAESPSAK